MHPSRTMAPSPMRLTLLFCALAMLPQGSFAQQSSGRPRGFNLLALPDLAATGMRAGGNFRFYVSNAGPMDVQQNLAGISPATMRRASNTGFISQFNEVTLFAAAAPGDWRRNRAIVPALAQATGIGAAVSYNYHFANPGITHWLPKDGSLGFQHSSARSTASTDATCLNHTASGLPLGVTLMAGSDCPQTWGANGYEGRRPVPSSAYQTIFSANPAGFRFNFQDVPVSLTDTTQFLGDRFATYAIANDYSRERRKVFGKVIPGGTGEPGEEGYPLGLEWKFDAFTFNAVPGVVFWQATVTNRTRELYGQPLDYDSLYAGVLTRHGRGVRGRAGFDIARGTAVFNENGHNNICDAAKPVPGVFSFGGYTGNCPGVSGFNSGASAIVMLKSPIGDLRYKQFNDPTSRFFYPTSPVAGDTITYNIGRMCGDDCIQERFLSPGKGFGVIAAREELALGGDSPSSLEPFQYWQLFHPANSAPYGLGPRVNLSNPRGGGGFNFFVPASYRYSTRPSSAPATGSDTLFLDTCNPIINQCVPHWRDTLPDRSINFTRNATWVGAGPFRLAADSSAALVLGIIAAPDSSSVERFINQTIALYQAFYVAPAPPPAPRVVSARVIGGDTRQTSIRILLDNRTIGYVDPFLQQLADRYRTAPVTTTEGRLQRVNRLGPLGRTIADTLQILASRNVERILVYKSCDGGRNYTTSNSPNLCTRDVIRDTLGRELGPAAYRVLSPDSSQFFDGNVLSGQSYYYAFVPVSRGVRLLLRDSTTTNSQRLVDTTLVAATSSIPGVASAPNVAVVYVPASQQSGSTASNVIITKETGPNTRDRAPGSTIDTTWNGLSVLPYDSIAVEQRFRLLFGDTVIVTQYSRTGVLDSTRVVVRRNITTGFTVSPPSGRTVLNVFAQPRKSRLDTLVFVSTSPSGVPIVGGTVSTTTATSGGTTVTTNTVFAGVGACFNTPFVSGVPLAPLPVGVIVSESGGNAPLIVSTRLCSVGGTTLNAAVLRSPEFRDVNIEVLNRPVITNSISTIAGGAQLVEKYIAFPTIGRLRNPGLADRPAVDWQQNVSRLIGTSFGELVVTFAGPEFGPGAPFSVSRGFQGLQADLNSSLQSRTNVARTAVDDSTIAVINSTLGLALTRDSLVEVTLPFQIVNRSMGNRPVTVALRRADKAASQIFGSGSDTIRVTIDSAHWVPGEPLILIQQSSIGVDSAGFAKKDAAGEPVTRDTLTMMASRAVLNCTAAVGPSCNPVIGRGGTGFVSFDRNQELHVRYAVPYTPEREFAFTVSPSITGTRITTVTKRQLDSVKVVPNPYILYSNFETAATNEQRVMFTHLPPQGTIRIYTVTGQFVQQLTWTPADLRGNGDLYYNLLTREGTLLASGLYLFSVTATGPKVVKRDQVGRFIVIR